MPPENRRRRRVKTGPDMTHWAPEDRAAAELAARLNTPVAEMALSVRIINTLEEYSVIVCRDLMTQTYESLMEMKNFGEKTLTEVRAAIQALGLTPPAWKKPKKPPRPPKADSHGILKLW
jgi:DNA-directed RNA polymerase alpha subunit